MDRPQRTPGHADADADSAARAAATPALAAGRHAYLWRYEIRGHRPLSIGRFALRVLAHVGVVMGLVGASVVAGLAGFMHYEHLAWRDAFLETAMLLGGMGPTELPRTSGGKLFASFFALYAGLLFIVAAAVLLSPAIHRVLHLFHWDRSGQPPSDAA